MAQSARPLVWLHGEVRTPPLSAAARLEAGALLRMVQDGVPVGLPHARAMQSVGKRCFELRIQDEDKTWRIIYRADPDAVVIIEVFSKKSQQTPQYVIDACKARLKRFDSASREE
jgi:phage-related protein